MIRSRGRTAASNVELTDIPRHGAHSPSCLVSLWKFGEWHGGRGKLDQATGSVAMPAEAELCQQCQIFLFIMPCGNHKNMTEVASRIVALSAYRMVKLHMAAQTTKAVSCQVGALRCWRCLCLHVHTSDVAPRKACQFKRDFCRVRPGFEGSVQNSS